MVQGLSPVNSNFQAYNAQMPTPNLKQESGQNPVQQTAAEQNVVQNTKQTAQMPQNPPLNLGVVSAPDNYSKTPITDSIARQEAQTPRTTLPAALADNKAVKPAGGKKSFKIGDLGAFLSIACFSVISAVFIPRGVAKIIKLIKH